MSTKHYKIHSALPYIYAIYITQELLTNTSWREKGTFFRLSNFSTLL